MIVIPISPSKKGKRVSPAYCRIYAGAAHKSNGSATHPYHFLSKRAALLPSLSVDALFPFAANGLHMARISAEEPTLSGEGGAGRTGLGLNRA